MTLVLTEFLIVSIITGVIISYLWSQRKPKNFPPGPWGFPILGHLPQIGIEGYKTAIKWKPKYGSIIGIDLGSLRGVMISDYKLIKEALNLNVTAGRGKFPFVLARFGEGKPSEGIVFSEGRTWTEQRRFTLRRLRDFGFGTKSMESIVHDEIFQLIEKFKQEVGAPISTRNRFNAAVVNALWTIISGQRFDQDDPKLNEIIKMLTESLADQSFIVRLAAFIPWIGKIIGNDKFNEPIKPTMEFLEPIIDEHMKSHVVDHPRDFIDTFIDEMKRTDDPSSSFHMSRKNSILYTIMDLFFAGAETTSTSLTWIFLYMARNQHVQEKMAEEIIRVVGDSRLPSLNDRPAMPYTEAVIHEVMRAATLTPFSIFHSTTEDITFHGYDIPKDTIIFPNIYEAHNNIELWGDPENFRPERFLSKDGTSFERHEGFIPFSTGKRVCLGEGLARDELFLFTSSLFQTFHVGLDPTSPPPNFDGNNGPIFSPKPHKIILSLRQ